MKRVMNTILVKLGWVAPPEAQEDARQVLRDSVHQYRNTASESVAASRRANKVSHEAIKTAENAIRMLEEVRATEVVNEAIDQNTKDREDHGKT